MLLSEAVENCKKFRFLNRYVGGILEATEIGAVLFGLFLIAGHFADAAQYSVSVLMAGEVIAFLGLLFGLGMGFSLDFGWALVISLIFLGIFTGIIWYFAI